MSSLLTENDFKALSQAEPIEPPALIHERLRTQVVADLNPRMARIVGKVGLIHFLAAGFSLVFCPQFGVGPLGGEFGVLDFFMKGGWPLCALGCGVLFMSGTGVFSAFLLNPDERRVFHKNSGWVFTALAALSFGFFMILSREKLDHLEKHFHHSNYWNLVWTLSAAVSAMLLFRKTSQLLSRSKPLLPQW
jgi:hypothetical protein